MSEQMPYADIVILALVAGFILLRLRGVLGQKIGHDKPTGYRPAPRAENDEPVVLPDRQSRRQQEESVEPANHEQVDEAARPGIEAVQRADAQFEVSGFLSGAKIAFEMVFDAFSKGDKETLRRLLSESIYKDFSAELEQRSAQDHRPDTTLVAVESLQIVRAEKTGSAARIAVRFISEQITVVRDRQGKIVEGDPSQVDRVEDEWTFERDTASRNPNWKIIDT